MKFVFSSSSYIFFSLFSFLISISTFAQNPGDKDNTFVIGNGTNGRVNGIEILPNGHLFIAGDFNNYNSQLHTGLLAVYPNGTPDTAFNANCVLNLGADVRSTSIDSNGNICVGGFINTVNGVASKNLARLLPTGELDTSFNIGIGANNEVTSISSNGQKVAISGFFSQYNGQARSGFAYLNHSGEIDTNFTTPTWSSSIYTQHLLPNNKVYVGGNFSSFHNAPFPRIARLNADGSIDSTFNPGNGASSPVEVIAVQPDGKVLIGGSFTSVNGIIRNRIARLNTNGSLDASFNPLLGASSTVRTIAVEANGKIIVGGQFNTFNGVSSVFIVQLNSNGTVDQNFVVGSGFNGSTHALAVQPDNKILVGGTFTQYKGGSSPRVIRLVGDSLPPAQPTVFSKPEYTATCFGDTVVLEVTSGQLGPNDHWEWRLNDCANSLVDTGWSVSFSPVTDTTTIAVKSSGAGVCSTVQLIVQDTIAPILLQPIPTLITYCEVTISAQNIPPAQDYCAGNIIGVPQGPLTYSVPGTYTLPWLFDDGNGNTSTYTQQIDVLTIDTSITLVANSALLAAHTTATAKYQWVDCAAGNFTPFPNDTFQLFTPQYSSKFAVIVTEGTCVDTSLCIEISFVSVDEFGKSAINIYPNPVQDILHIETAEPCTLALMDLNGRTIRVFEIKSTSNLDLSGLAQGAYLYELVNEYGYSKNGKLIKL